MQPKLTPEDVQLLRQLNERDRQVLGGMPRPRAADGLRVLCVGQFESGRVVVSQFDCGRASVAVRC